MPTLTFYRPNPVVVPKHVKIRRDVLRHVDGELKNIPFAEAGDIGLSWHDSTTLFYDIFLADKKNYLFCIAPPFHNFGKPHTILLMGQSHPFTTSPYFPYETTTIIRVCLDQSVKNQLQNGGEMIFEFDEFSVSTIYQHISPSTKRIYDVAVTPQECDSIQCIRELCYEYSSRETNDIVIYNTGSQDRMRLKTELADVPDKTKIILMAWDFPSGLNPNTTDHAEKHLNNYAESTANKHHYVLFGTKSDDGHGNNEDNHFYVRRWDNYDSLLE